MSYSNKYLRSKFRESNDARKSNIMRWPENMLNSMNAIQISIIDVNESCLLSPNSYSKLVSTSLIQICTFLPKILNKLWLECTIPSNGQQIWLIQCMSLNFQSKM